MKEKQDRKRRSLRVKFKKEIIWQRNLRAMKRKMKFEINKTYFGINRREKMGFRNKDDLTHTRNAK